MFFAHLSDLILLSLADYPRYLEHRERILRSNTQVVANYLVVNWLSFFFPYISTTRVF